MKCQFNKMQTISSRVLLLFALGCSSGIASAQVQIAKLMEQKPQLVSRVDPGKSTAGQVVLSMDFNSPVILNPRHAAALNDKVVLKVELLYTAFQVSANFQQPELNRKRLEELKKLAPYLFNRKGVVWTFTGQNGCKTEAEAKQFFHGFVITYRSPATAASMIAEIEGMKKIAVSDSLGTVTWELVKREKIKKKYKKTGLYEPRLKSKRIAGITYKKRSIWNRRPLRLAYYDTIVSFDTVKSFRVSEHALKFLSDNLHDSTIFGVMKRNVHWKNIHFVCDVTSSMWPYSTQLLIWHKMNFNLRNSRYYTFFNDGDNTPDNKKRLGRTGGIYHVSATGIADVENTAMDAMKRGGGGDAPENNVEALISASEKYRDAGDIVLVADNQAPIKDMLLLSQLKKPVHVILCGTQYGPVNTDYLDLALKTGGSLHTLEEDFNLLTKLEEGQTIEIGRNLYRMNKGKFSIQQAE
jgi:hypothetical protein